jgi:hypothetical protein
VTRSGIAANVVPNPAIEAHDLGAVERGSQQALRVVNAEVRAAAEDERARHERRTRHHPVQGSHVLLLRLQKTSW